MTFRLNKEIGDVVYGLHFESTLHPHGNVSSLQSFLLGAVADVKKVLVYKLEVVSKQEVFQKRYIYRLKVNGFYLIDLDGDMWVDRNMRELDSDTYHYEANENLCDEATPFELDDCYNHDHTYTLLLNRPRVSPQRCNIY